MEQKQKRPTTFHSIFNSSSSGVDWIPNHYSQTPSVKPIYVIKISKPATHKNKVQRIRKKKTKSHRTTTASTNTQQKENERWRNSKILK